MSHTKFFLLMALCVASSSAQVPGMDIFNGMFQAAAGMVQQSMNLGMTMMKQAFDMVPIKEAIAMSEAAMKSVQNYPEQIMAIFNQAAGAAGGMASPAGQMFNMAASKVEKMKEEGAPKEEYMDLMKKMKEAMGAQ